MIHLKYIFTCVVLLGAITTNAQKIDSIYVNLYTDSLKKGTYNYINIDGLLSNGSYRPLDSTQVCFYASEGTFSGNSLWLPLNFTAPKVTVKVTLRSNPAIRKEFELYIKTMPDNEVLKTAEEILNEIKNKPRNPKAGS